MRGRPLALLSLCLMLSPALALAQPPAPLQVISAFEVAPQQRELCDPPGPKPWNAKKLSERR